MLAPFEYAAPDPSAAEFQPMKLRPERLKLFVLIAVAMPEFTVWFDIEPVPPFALNEISEVLAVTLKMTVEASVFAL